MTILLCMLFWVVFGVAGFIAYVSKPAKPVTNTYSSFRDLTDDEIAIADDVERHS